MTGLLVAVGLLMVGFGSGLLVTRGPRYRRGVEHGRRLTELEHGYPPPTSIRPHRRARWVRADRKPVPSQPKRPAFYR